MKFKVTISSSKFFFFCYLLHWKPVKSDEHAFYFILKAFFRSQDIKVFVTTFSSSKKNGFIIKISLTSKFMMSQPGLK